MMSKSFEQWNYEKVENSFGLNKVKHLPALATWLTSDEPIKQEELAVLQQYQDLLIDNVDAWNEEELKMFFIGPILNLVGYYHQKYHPFLGRVLSAKINTVTLNGVVDFMLASGKINPKQPYFCLHEYKKMRGRNNDPLGQLLIAMVCAQAKNDKAEQPIYGLFIEGRLWYFTVLLGHDYAVSEPYIATKADIGDIFRILRKLKSLIEPWLF